MELGSRIKGGILGAAAAVIGLAIGLSPAGWRLEEAFGLDVLFRLRGPLPTPEDVVLVTIDRNASKRFGLPNEPRHWPRGLHARLVQRLAGAGTRVIAFDMIFDSPREPAADRAFAEAIGAAGNVVLFEYLRRDTIALGATGDDNILQVEQRVPPIRALADAAAGLAPFPLPKVPAKVRQVWLFKPEIGDAATFPAAVLQLHLRRHYPALRRLVMASASGPTRLPERLTTAEPARTLNDSMRALRRLFVSDRRLAERLQPALRPSLLGDSGQSEALRTLVRLYAGPHSRYLNYYGPPGTVRTLAYDHVLEDASVAELRRQLAGTTVFVGFAEQFQPEQRDGFYTVFSQDTGLDISGVEIAATGFANLLHGETIAPVGGLARVLLLVASGLVLGVLLRAAPTFAVLPSALALGGLYLFAAVLAFRQWQLWSPLMVVLAVQLPVAAIGAVLWRHLDLHRERANIRRAFGYHLPPPVVDRLARGLERVGPSHETIYGVCLASDAEQYSALSESLPPTELHRRLNRYYEVLFTPVRERDGVISDVIGDAMLAIWASAAPEPDLRRRACLAGLEIVAAIESAAGEDDTPVLPTRIGIHCGAITLGHVGAVDHFEYRAVGDIVNTASRIEGLCKTLGCRLLASAETVVDLEDILSRELGSFAVKGKREPVVVHEPLGLASAPNAAQLRRRCRRFALALAKFRAREWNAATAAFADYEQHFGPDGPARYYLSRIETLRNGAHSDRHGASSAG